MARKLFISVLGDTDYGECYYTKASFKSCKVRFIQEATLAYITKEEKWTNNDAALILLTKKAESSNWVDDGHKTKEGETKKQSGLYSRLQQMNLPISITPLNNLPDGNNEDEIWEVFQRTFDAIEEGDELYFDITHGFRYLPMLILVLGNYSKFLKNTEIKSITYGNYVSRNKLKEEAPIIDLLPISYLQDWTTAAISFLDSGNVKRFSKLCSSQLKPILRDEAKLLGDTPARTLRKFVNALNTVVSEMYACRSISILKSENIAKLLDLSSQIEKTTIKPLNPILQKIKDSFKDFVPSPDIINGYAAAKWCFDKGLYQQSLTILHENIVSQICKQENLQVNSIEERDLVSYVFKIYYDNDCKYNENKDEKINMIQRNVLFQALASSFRVTTNLRNDYNHSGMRSNPTAVSKITNDLKERLEKVMAVLKAQGYVD